MRVPEKRQLENGKYAMKCPFCGHEVVGDLSSGEALYEDLKTQFRDDISIEEFFISNLCQSCQDKTFGDA